MDEMDDYEYGANPAADMWTDYDYHVNTGELSDLFDDEPEDDSTADSDYRK